MRRDVRVERKWKRGARGAGGAGRGGSRGSEVGETREKKVLWVGRVKGGARTSWTQCVRHVLITNSGSSLAPTGTT